MEDVTSLSLYDQKFEFCFNDEELGTRKWTLSKRVNNVDVCIELYQNERAKFQWVLKFDSVFVHSNTLVDLINQFRAKMEQRFKQQLILNHLMFESEKAPVWDTELDEGD